MCLLAANLSAAFEEQAQQEATASLSPPLPTLPALPPSPLPSPQLQLLQPAEAQAADAPRCASPGSPQVAAQLLTLQPAAQRAGSPLAVAPGSGAAAAPVWPSPPLQPPAPSPQQPSEDTVTLTPPRLLAAAAGAAEAALASPLEVFSEAAGAASAGRFASRRRAHSCPNPKVTAAE